MNKPYTGITKPLVLEDPIQDTLALVMKAGRQEATEEERQYALAVMMALGQQMRLQEPPSFWRRLIQWVRG